MQGLLFMTRIYWMLPALDHLPHIKGEAKWDLLDRIQENTEG
jgi:hypothetical protein